MSAGTSPAVTTNLERMKHALRELAVKEYNLGDAKFIAIDRWNDRGEQYLEDALCVMVIDSSGLHQLLNLGCDTTEFDDLIESFGFYYAMGHSWSLGFYAIDGYDFTRVTGTYAQKLSDPRWKEKATKVKLRAGHLCQDCGSSGALDAHHCYYLGMRQSYEPWEYPLSAFRALCRTCHTNRELSEIRMRAFAASLTQTQLESLRESFDHARYWYSPESIFDFLAKLGPSPEHRARAMDLLISGIIKQD